MKKLLGLAVVIAGLGVACGQENQAQPIPSDLQLLMGKQVVIGRIQLCVPKTFTRTLAYSGKTATVVAVTPNPNKPIPPSALATMAPDMREMMEDSQKGATLLFQFEDGTKFDTCAPVGPKMLSQRIDLAPGQNIMPLTPQTVATNVAAGSTVPVSSALPTMQSTTAVATAPASPQECPVMITKLTSGDGGIGHAFADAMTTSEFQRQLDETSHGGHAKHYLDIRERNNSAKPIAAVEEIIVYFNKMGDETLRDKVVSQNKKSIAPGAERKSFVMDRTQATANGAGTVTMYINRVRFEDDSVWQDNGSHSCSFSNKAK